ncbi:MAG: sulfatase [bacterium]|nr:sulfatase [bacterium]
MFDWAPVVAEDSAMADGQVVGWAERQLARERDEPLFLAVGIYRPHVPWYVPEKYFDMFPLEEIELPKVLEGDLDDVPEAGKRNLRRKWQSWIVENNQWKKAVQGYLASIAFADVMVGRLLDALERSGRERQTVIVLWSDHGYHLGVKEHWEKFALWEQTTRVPLIFVAPGITSEGARSKRPVSALDIYPTLAGLCGLPLPGHIEGRSLLPLLDDPDAEWNHAAVSTHLRNNHAVRSERFRYIRYADGSEELYDHLDDPLEWRNLAGRPDYAAVTAGMRKWLPKVNAEPDPPRRE